MATELETRTRHIELASRAILTGEEVEGLGSDSEAASRMILERILSSETFEEAFTPQTLTPWREYLEVPVRVTDFRFNRSGYEQGSPIYVVADIVLPTGEVDTVTMGGRNVLAQLLVMLKHGWFDRSVMLTGKKTGEGYTVYWLVPGDGVDEPSPDEG